MAEITIHIPDEFLEQVDVVREQIPILLQQIFRAIPAEKFSTQIPVVYTELVDFLVSRPTPEQIMNFKVSSETQSRLQELLVKNSEVVLTIEENTELDIYEQMDYLLTLLKAKAYGIAS